MELFRLSQCAIAVWQQLVFASGLRLILPLLLASGLLLSSSLLGVQPAKAEFLANQPATIRVSETLEPRAAEDHGESPLPQQPDASSIPSETVSQFVQAYLEVVDLVEQREIDLQRAETEAESLQIQREIQREAFERIESAGLTRQQYWQLLGLANIDPDFRERVLAQVEEASL